MLVAIRWGLEEFLTRNNGIHKDDREQIKVIVTIIMTSAGSCGYRHKKAES